MVASSSSATKFLCFFLILGLASPSLAAVKHVVGGDLGWNLGVNYDLWAAGEEFHVGDTLEFNYNPLRHNVVQVKDLTSLLSCLINSILFSDDSGSTSIVLKEEGELYFTSSLGLTDCLLGNMRLKVPVLPALA